jgi:hypothetical protein
MSRYRGMVARTARYPARHGIPHGTVSRAAWHPTARYPARHGIPRGMASRTARYPARHGIPRGTVSRTAWYPARHGTHGMQADNYQCCAPFMERVSADDVPDYYEIVTNPMDLSTVRPLPMPR